MTEQNPTIQPTGEGVRLNLSPPNREPFHWDLPLQGAIAFWHDWWKALGRHYPKEETNPDLPNPLMLETGDFSFNVHVNADNFCLLWLRPLDCAGIGFDFKADEARKLAATLLQAADYIDSVEVRH